MASAAARPAAIWSWPGWPNTTPVMVVRLPPIQRMAWKAKQPPAAASSEADEVGCSSALPAFPGTVPERGLSLKADRGSVRLQGQSPAGTVPH